MVAVILVLGWLGTAINNAHQRQDNANATATTQAITVKDMAQMHAALDSRIPKWHTVTDQHVHHVSAAAAGFGPNDNTKEVVYGYCVSHGFYVYVLENSTPGSFGDTEGYAYTPSYSAKDCSPPDWAVLEADRVDNDYDWSFVTLSTVDATLAARPTSPPTPTETATATPQQF